MNRVEHCARRNMSFRDIARQTEFWRTCCSILEYGFCGLHGTGCVKCGERELGFLPYEVEVGSGGQASVVKFERVRGRRTAIRCISRSRMAVCSIARCSTRRHIARSSAKGRISTDARRAR